MDDMSSTYRVVPFGNPRVKGYLHLTAAYRSLSRPSSPPRAKASAMRPSLLFFRRQYLAGLTYTFRLVSLLVLLSHHVIDRFSNSL